MGLKIIEYRVLTHSNLDGLVDQTKEALGEGWWPLGGATPSPGWGFMQTMVEYETPGKDKFYDPTWGPDF